MASDAHIRTWVRLIQAGRKTLDDVPKSIRKDVEKALEDD